MAGMPWVAIDYGTAFTRAILVRPGAAELILQFDGGWQLSSAVHVSSGVTVGAAAWRAATTDPDGFVASPLRAGTGTVSAGPQEVEVADLVAATLRQVMAEASRAAGEPVTEARMVAPAGWGPRRRTWLRHAARNAGIHVYRFIEAPVAAAPRVAPRPAVDGASGRMLLVIDLGATCEATVLREEPDGYEVLSTLADADAGGDQIDTALAVALLATELNDLPDTDRWATLATLRATRHALSEQVAVAMPVPGASAPLVVNAVQVAQAAQPVFERAAQVAAEAVAAADLTLAEIHGVHLIGGLAATPGAAEQIAAKFGVTPQPAQQPSMTAVLGAADAGPDTAGSADQVPLTLPPWRRLVWLGLPGVASLLLFMHFVAGADISGAQPLRVNRDDIYVLLASWPELTLAAVLALIGFMQAGALFATLIEQTSPSTRNGPLAGSRITAGLGAAIAAGLATATLYALTAAAYFVSPREWTLQWAVWPIVPAAALGAAVAYVAWRRRVASPGGWDEFLAFPVSSIITATLGVFFATVWASVRLPYYFNGWRQLFAYAGAVLVAIAIACAATDHRTVRIVISVVLSLFLIILTMTIPGYNLLGVLYAAGVALWWLRRLWILLQVPAVPRR
jgi:hypothetical protein